MNRRLVLAGVLVAVIGSGVAGTASAASPATADTTTHKVCIDHQVLLPDGFCVVWDDPLSR